MTKSTDAFRLGNISPDSDFDGDITREIREESNRIQKELELERKANQLRHSTPTKSSSSSHSSTPCNSTTGTVIHQVSQPIQSPDETKIYLIMFLEAALVAW